jgi:rhodanese-related sulfurtransferase
MSNRLPFLCFLILAIASGCTQGQTKNSLPPQAFADKITQTADGTVLDVRTPEEYAEGHLANAKNMDWNGDHFEHQIMALDKSKPVFVYCLKGGRSASAASKMRSLGFKDVYELDGGIAKWQEAKLPVVKE